MTYPRIDIAAENALMINFGERSTPELTQHIMRVTTEISQAFTHGFIDCVPSYVTLLVIFDCAQHSHAGAQRIVQSCLKNSSYVSTSPSHLHVLPVYYDADYCPDLSRIAQLNKVSTETIIEWHTAREYHVYAIGFAPGFAYLGEVDERLQFPRLSTPRKVVPVGAVAIAERQTAVYPMASPGGWHILGLCPTTLFDLDQDPSTPFNVGDTVKFDPIGQERFLELGGQRTSVEDVEQ